MTIGPASKVNYMIIIDIPGNLNKVTIGSKNPIDAKKVRDYLWRKLDLRSNFKYTIIQTQEDLVLRGMVNTATGVPPVNAKITGLPKVKLEEVLANPTTKIVKQDVINADVPNDTSYYAWILHKDDGVVIFGSRKPIPFNSAQLQEKITKFSLTDPIQIRTGNASVLKYKISDSKFPVLRPDYKYDLLDDSSTEILE